MVMIPPSALAQPAAFAVTKARADTVYSVRIAPFDIVCVCGYRHRSLVCMPLESQA